MVAIDAGLRAYMIRVYNYMMAGLALTGLVAWFTFSAGRSPYRRGPPAYAVRPNNLPKPADVAVHPRAARPGDAAELRHQPAVGGTALTLFFVYAGAHRAVAGVDLPGLHRTPSITRVFFITAATFGAMSLYGYTTQRDLTGLGSFLFMGLIGIIIACVVNIFLHSSGLDFAISVIGVLVFVGLTAYDTQRSRRCTTSTDDGSVAGRKAVMGALRLYLDFINLFLMLLRLFGDRR